MATRKLSAETPATYVPNNAVFDVTVYPSGIPSSRGAPLTTIGDRIGPSYRLRALTAADLGSYTLPNGGSVGGVSVSSSSGAPVGFVDDIIQISVTNPTPPGGGPCVVSIPLLLPNGIPPHFRIKVSTFPAAVPVDFAFGYMLTSDAGTSLAIYNTRNVTPPVSRIFQVSELDPGSGSPAGWSTAVPYSASETLLLDAKTASPFTAVPQIELYFSISGDGGVTYDNAPVFMNYPTVGNINDTGNWTGAVLDSIALTCVFGTAHVGTIDTTLALATDF